VLSSGCYNFSGREIEEVNEYIASNKELWENWTLTHEKSEFYDNESFKAGRNTLHQVEIEEVGEVAGKSLLHLQCHFGQDTLSWARRGAKVTGADFAENAIKLARSLATELGIDANFVCANLYDLPSVLEGQFDIIYTSGGVLWWLPDMAGWGKVISHFLKPGGVFYVRDQHPFGMVFEEVEGRLEPLYPYWQSSEPLKFDTHGSYASASDYRSVEYGWNHSLGEIVNALTSQGLQVEFLHEWPFLFFKMFPSMERDEQGRWWLPNRRANIPMSFSIRATKPLAHGSEISLAFQ
jgi:SAM-dependent methyltransferase